MYEKHFPNLLHLLLFRFVILLPDTYSNSIEIDFLTLGHERTQIQYQ